MRRKKMHDQLVQIIVTQVMDKLNSTGLVNKTADRNNNNDQNPGIKPTVIDGIVTARKLVGCDVINISKNSIITPAARDYIKEKKIQLVLESPTIVSNKTGINQQAGWYYWSACSLLKNIEPQYQPDIPINFSSINNGEENTLAAIKDLDRSISNGNDKGGILVVRTSAQAVFLGSLYQNLRLVVGSFPKTIEDGIRLFDANVLILEHAYLGKSAMTEMIRLFTTTKRPLALDQITKPGANTL